MSELREKILDRLFEMDEVEGGGFESWAATAPELVTLTGATLEEVEATLVELELEGLIFGECTDDGTQVYWPADNS